MGMNVWCFFDEFLLVFDEIWFYLGVDCSFLLGEVFVVGDWDYVFDFDNLVFYMLWLMFGFWQGGQVFWKVMDQCFVDCCFDVFSWQFEFVIELFEVCGVIDVYFVVVILGFDVDWIVKFIDVYFEDYEVNFEFWGFQLMVVDEVF